MPSACVMIPQRVGSSAGRQRKAAQPRQARWAGSRRDGSQHAKIFVSSLNYPGIGSTAFARPAQQMRLSTIWIPA